MTILSFPIFKQILILMIVVWVMAVLLRRIGLPTIMGELVAGIISQTLKTSYNVDNQLITSFNEFINLQANTYLSEKACRYGWKTGQDTSVKYF